MNNKKCTVYCVNSIKGGCGKTTVALSLTYTIMQDLEAKYRDNTDLCEDENDNNDNKPKVCYIDLDILGTGVEYIIYGENSEAKYYNDIEYKLNSYEQIEEYINKIDRVGSDIPIDCILLSADAKKKKNFLKGNHNYNSDKNMNVFLKRTENLLKLLINEKGYDAIIIDSSPSYDDFPREIYRFLKNLSIESLDENKSINRVYNLFISTLENSHILTTISSLVDLMKSEDVESENIRLILNDTTNYFNDKKIKNKISKDELIKKVLETYDKVYRKYLKDIGSDYEPAEQTFKESCILFKKYCAISQKNIFTRGEQLNGIKDYEYIIDDNLSLLNGDET